MTSLERGRFFELHFEHRYQIQRITLTGSRDKDTQVEVILFKGSETEILKSGEEDFVIL